MSSWNRRAFLGTAAGATAAYAAGDGWIDLFDGKSLNGWIAAENIATWKVAAGNIANDGPRSHLFYVGPKGPDNAPSFKNFELEAEVMARPYCNSGLYFHTKVQTIGFPIKGFEVQINNTALGEGSYRERKKTGSLYSIRNIHKQIAADDTYMRLRAVVRGKNVQIWVNDIQTVDYTEPTPPVLPPSAEKERFLDRGTFALQGHDPGSRSLWRKVRVKPLPDNAAAPGAQAPVVDALFHKVIELGAKNYPLVDFHVRLQPGLDLAAAMARSRRDGVNYGIVAGFANDAAALKYVDSFKGTPAFIGIEGDTKGLSRAMLGKFDYILFDAATAMPAEVGTVNNIQEFMDTHVKNIVALLDHEPIDIYANPTYLPPSIAADAERLWTEDRLRRVLGAAAINGVALELNNPNKLPGEAAVRMAKDLRCKFTLGSNNVGRCEYGFQMIETCKLGWNDLWVPGAAGTKAIDRRSATNSR
jgi:hypothetical protein